MVGMNGKLYEKIEASALWSRRSRDRLSAHTMAGPAIRTT